jgi:glycosyltransferase involved in cell wall biosynthesis
LKQQGAENIRFLGFVTGAPMQALLTHAYAYVLPSEIEGLSTGLIEAMAYANCVLVSDIEENLEAISPQGGLSFPSGSVTALRDRLEQLMRDPALVERYRHQAREHALREYDWEKVTDQFEELYVRMTS